MMDILQYKYINMGLEDDLFAGHENMGFNRGEGNKKFGPPLDMGKHPDFKGKKDTVPPIKEEERDADNDNEEETEGYWWHK